jgi:hypothetical protein
LTCVWKTQLPLSQEQITASVRQLQKSFAAQGAKVFVTFYRDTCRYSEEELQQAKQAA